MRPYRLAAIVLTLLLGTAGMAFAADQAVPGRPLPWEMGLQAAASPVKHQMEDFHNLLLVIIVAICIFVLALVGYVAVRFNAKRNPVPSKTSHNTVIEVIWTVAPVLILLVIAIPSFRLLYFLDRAENPEMTVQATGYQWYWGYKLPDQQIEAFASYIVADEDQIGRA